jgi:DNA primase
LWAPTLNDSDSTTRYLYLRGASRAELPPYGLSEVLRLSPPERTELVLVEGLMDVHHLQAKGFPNIAAVGGARLRSGVTGRLRSLGFESVVLAFDNDSPGREGLARAIDDASRSREAPALRVLEPARLGRAKDPDAFIRAHGPENFRALLDEAGCAITWRALELTQEVAPEDDAIVRRAALARAGKWLGTLPARLALEQEDAVRHVADRCGYSSAAVERAFRARFWARERRSPAELTRSW